MQKIKFIDTVGVAKECYPKPSSTFIPEWYKSMDSYINGNKIPPTDGGTASTIKRCMPVFDAISAGYIITLPVDVDVFIPKDKTLWVKGKQHFKWSIINPIKFHPIEQAPNHPNERLERRGLLSLKYWNQKTRR